MSSFAILTTSSSVSKSILVGKNILLLATSSSNIPVSWLYRVFQVSLRREFFQPHIILFHISRDAVQRRKNRRIFAFV